ncbi:carboxymuconolactone decarboxylase family protein [Streptomyces sp. NPDC050548]|uniref:carboxymuconolactone decarboxylase family protein n=1 Tax=Streptomyces sp. NPDC050548 TaxID=3365629 RepID=UPI0037957BA3
MKDPLRALGLETMSSVVNTSLPADADLRDRGVGSELVEIGLVSVWAELWARDGLARRDRSLVTLGILIALGAEDELGSHVRIGLNNGLTEDEISEVLYHATGYAGFPRAMAARKAARKALDQARERGDG